MSTFQTDSGIRNVGASALVVTFAARALHFILMLSVTGLVGCGAVEDPSLLPEYDSETRFPIPSKEATEFNPQGNLFWGDLHIHTSLSTDAWMMGVRATPDDAYRFTRGGEIEHAGGYGIKLKRPLDFAAVTDHSEYLGLMRATDPDLPLSRRSFKERVHNDGKVRNTIAFLRTTMGFSLKDVGTEGWENYTKGAWQETIDAAQRNYIPGEFTTFVAYEWSSAPERKNLHRNVIYRDTNVPDIPYSSLNSSDPRDLWSELERQRKEGKSVFAIPHNGNSSQGKMYDAVMYDGGKMDATYARRRMINEPVSEIFQVKGSSETHPSLSPADEFAGFEIDDRALTREAGISEPEGGYVRDALRRGLEMSHAEGFNPYRFGFIGSSDGHNASSPVEEDSYHGKLPLLDGSAATRLRENTYIPRSVQGGTDWSAAGLAGVWSQENTRESLFDAMLRKETYATSGPRITVRFYAGWTFSDDLFASADWLSLAQDQGVPMGGRLRGSTPDARPRFAIWAIRDPDSGNLDRIQIIKGWADDSGKSHEKIFNVAWSGDRKLDLQTGLPPVGNTVDVPSAAYTNTIGADQLSVVWTDVAFDPSQEAFYYARVIEIPTPRWSTYDAKTLNINPPEPTSIQERAVTSAIWYSPEYD